MLSRMVSGLLIGALACSSLQGQAAAGEAPPVGVEPGESAPAARALAEVPAPQVRLSTPLKTPSLILVGTGAKRNTLDVHGWGADAGAVYQLWERHNNGAWKKSGPRFRAPNDKERRVTRAFPASWRGTTVAYRLEKTKRSAGEPRYSKVVQVSAGRPAFNVHSVGTTSITLRWHRLTDVKGYRIVAKNGTGKWVKVAHVTKPSTTSLRLTSVGGVAIKPGAAYSFRMVGCTKISATSCTPLKTVKSKGKKAAPIMTQQAYRVDTVTSKAPARAGAAITKMLGGTTKSGGLLYLKGTSLSTPVGVSKSHPYLKYVWDGAHGVLEFHLFVKYMIVGKAPAGSRSGWTMKTIYQQGATQVWGRNMLTGSNYDFGSDTQFYTRMVFHDWANRASEKHPAGQAYLNVQIGGRGPCSEYWYSECGGISFGFSPTNIDGETWIFLPWDTEARVDGDARTVKSYYPNYFRFTTAGLRVSGAHETGHAFGLTDGYTEPTGKKWDRMMDNAETTLTTSRGVRYAHLMKDDEVFINGKALERSVVTANDVEMALYAYKKAYNVVKNPRPDIAEYAKIFQYYASYGGERISCMIRNRTIDDAGTRNNSKGTACH